MVGTVLADNGADIMGRVIKFRGWNGRKMHRVCYVTDKGIGALGDGGMIIPRSDSAHALMQFTGLKDINGVEIYEGDIVEDHNGAGIVEYVEKYAAFRVNYTNGQAKWFYDYNLKGERESIEIIGDIYQNPELLPRC